MEALKSLVRRIDFAQGFSSYFVKWRFPNESCSSGYFMTSTPFLPVGAEDENNISDDNRRWSLSATFQEAADTVQASFSLISAIRDPQKAIPVAYRIAISNNGKEMEKCGFHAFHPENNRIDLKGSFAAIFLSEKHVGEFHCWLFIPKALRQQYPLFWFFRPTNHVPVLLKSAIGNGDNEDDEDISDVQLVIVDEDKEPLRRFYCHRNILANSSPDFKRMFSKRQWSEMETGTNGKRVVTIPVTDINEVAMEKMLAYVYDGILPELDDSFDADSLIKLINAAEKYNLMELKYRCELICIWRMDDPIKMLRVANLFNLNRLKTICILLLSTNLPLVIKERKEGVLTEEQADAIIMKSHNNLTNDIKVKHILTYWIGLDQFESV